MPTRLRSSITSTSGWWMSTPRIRIDPRATRVPSIRSFMRFRQRSSVDLPQPEGPMKAVTFFSSSERHTSCSAWEAP